MGAFDFRFMPDDWKAKNQDLVNPKKEDKETQLTRLMIETCKYRIEDTEKMRHIFGDEKTDEIISKWKNTLEELEGGSQ